MRRKTNGRYLVVTAGQSVSGSINNGIYNDEETFFWFIYIN